MSDEKFNMDDLISEVDEEQGLAEPEQTIPEAVVEVKTESKTDNNDDEVWSGDDWSWSGKNSWLWGGALILIGGGLLIQNLTGWSILHWWNFWAIFLIVPGLNMLLRSFHKYKATDTLDQTSRKTFIFGSALTLIGISFLFNIDFTFIWPVIFIAIGFYFLVTARK